MELTPHGSNKNKLMKGQYTKLWEELMGQTKFIEAWPQETVNRMELLAIPGIKK